MCWHSTISHYKGYFESAGADRTSKRCPAKGALALLKPFGMGAQTETKTVKGYYFTDDHANWESSEVRKHIR